MNRICPRPFPLIASVFLLLLVFAAGCSQEQAAQNEPAETQAEAAMQVAVVDEARIFNESNAGLEGVKMLNELNKSLREQLAGMQSAAQDNGTDEDVANFRGAVQRYQQIMNEQQRALYDSVQEQYVAVLAEYRQDNGIAVVFGQETALSFSPDVDITDAIIAELNNAEVELPTIDPAEFSLEADETAQAMGEQAPAMGEEPAAVESATQEETVTETSADENATQEESAEEPAADNASGDNATQ